ncbi:MAG: hypothetical protein ABSE96_00840 [Terracidiphilus sp.]
MCPSADEISALAAMLNKSKTTTILAGAGCAGAHKELLELAGKLKAPIVHALRGKEFVEYDNPFSVGMTGLLGFSSGYHAMMNCDTLLMLGTDFPYQQFYPPDATIIQIDIRGEQIGRRTKVDLDLVGDVRVTIAALITQLRANPDESHLSASLSHYDEARKGLDANGNFWLFGGGGYDAAGNVGSLSDLWEFNPSANQWAWMSGSNTASAYGEPGVYGTLGSPAAGNFPGSRYSASSWTDSSGHLWLFGGEGYDSTDEEGWLNDLWEYNISLNEWAWMGGSGIVNNFGVYGTLGTPAAANVPGGRFGALSWTDSNGHFWLFGGDGEAASDSGGDLNDLWEFDPSTNQRAWMSGSSSTVGTNGGQPGVYGTLGTPAAGNIPGGRFFL